jgi:hypothetical protein
MAVENKVEDCLLAIIAWRIESISEKIKYCLHSIDHKKQMDRFFEFKTTSLLGQFL